MANRRMFSREIIDTDAFLDMPTSTRLLYYDLGMRADDDGFLQDVQKIIRFTGAGKDDLHLLIAKGYVIPFDSGIVVIRHWRIHNQIRADRRKPTVCVNEMATLTIGENGIYEELVGHCQVVAKRLSDGCQHGNPVEDSIEESSRGEDAAAAVPLDDVDGLIRCFQLVDSQYVRDSLLEDINHAGYAAVEEALKKAANSNSRERISVNFYRTILNGSSKQAEAYDPYAGVPVLGKR